MISIAYLCFENPFSKPSSGGKRGMISRIQSFCLLENIKLDLFILSNRSEMNIPLEDIKEKYKSVSNIYIFPFNQSPFILFGKYPICDNKRFNKDCVREFKKHSYDVAVFEGEQVAIYRYKNVVNAKRYIIYFADIESEYRRQLADATKNPLKKIVYWREAKKFRFIEKHINAYFDDAWFVSNDEFKRFKKNIYGKGWYLPIPSIDFANGAKSPNDSHTILFVGDFALPNNLASIIWFTNNVFPIINGLDKKAKLLVVGRIDENNKKRIEKNGVSVLGYVDNINQLYCSSSCFACPLLFGAGVKVKTIDAISQGMIVITNSKGIEGTELIPGKHLIVKNSARELADSIVDVLNNNENYYDVAKEGFEFVKKNHSIYNQARIMKLSIDKIMKD